MFKKLNEIEISGIIKYLDKRFGIDSSVFNKFKFFISGKKIWITPKSLDENLVKREESVGLMFMRIEKNERIKLSTNAAQIFGRYATKNVVELNNQQLYEALRGLDITVDEDSTEDGYVLLKYQNDVLGIGQKRGSFVKNMIPKARRIKKF